MCCCQMPFPGKSCLSCLDFLSPSAYPLPGLCALSINHSNSYVAYPGSQTTGEIVLYDGHSLVGGTAPHWLYHHRLRSVDPLGPRWGVEVEVTLAEPLLPTAVGCAGEGAGDSPCYLPGSGSGQGHGAVGTATNCSPPLNGVCCAALHLSPLPLPTSCPQLYAASRKGGKVAV